MRRTAEQGQRMIGRAKELFAQIAERHGLHLEWDTQSPVEAAATLPKQRGLDFRLWLNLQNVDEIGVQTELFTASWFPFDDPKTETLFLTAVDGLISGDVRMLCFYGPIFVRPHKVILQRRVGDRWEQIYKYGRLYLLTWPVKEKIVINGGLALPCRNRLDR